MGLRYPSVGQLGKGIRASERENSPAFGFSIMITASYGVVSALQPSPQPWEVFLFAVGGVAGFTLTLAASTKWFQDASTDANRLEVLFVTSALNMVSVLGSVGAAALVAWLGTGWYTWLVSPALAASTYSITNGMEYVLAEEEGDDGGSDDCDVG